MGLRIDALSRHGRACLGHPDVVKRGGHRIEITGTRPVMTWGMALLDPFPRLRLAGGDKDAFRSCILPALRLARR
jgi:hypothetical protein